MDWTTVLGFLSKWLSSGPLGIILGIVGLGGIGLVFSRLIKKAKSAADQANLNSDINEASRIAGTESAALSENMRGNTAAMNAAVKEEQERQLAKLKPEISAPATAPKGVKFTVVVKNVRVGLPIYADKQYILAYTSSYGKYPIALTVAGERTLGVEVDGTWYTTTITITEE
jgi:hypothetical protein